MEVKRAKNSANEQEKKLLARIKDYEKIVALWGEFDPELIKIEDVKMSVKKIAGVKTPVLEGIDFKIMKFSLFNKPIHFKRTGRNSY